MSEKPNINPSIRESKTIAMLVKEMDDAIHSADEAKTEKQRQARAKVVESTISSLESRVREAESWLSDAMSEDDVGVDLWSLVLDRYTVGQDALERGKLWAGKAA